MVHFPASHDGLPEASAVAPATSFSCEERQERLTKIAGKLLGPVNLDLGLNLAAISATKIASAFHSYILILNDWHHFMAFHGAFVC